MRMLVSLLLVLLMIFYRRGLFGKREISWDWVFARFGKITGKGRRHGLQNGAILALIMSVNFGGLMA